MHMRSVSRWLLISGLSLLYPVALGAQPVATEDPWSISRDVVIASQWPQGDELHEDHITADVYRPRNDQRVPAAIIINSSGGVSAQTELYYARMLARNGMASLVVDSFTLRGARRTADDQRRVAQSKSNADAIAGYRWLVTQAWVDPARIIVLGMSRGGEAAYSAALVVLRKKLMAGDVHFAAHVAITPGGCNFQQSDARTTGAPIFFMLAELDEINRVPACIDYIQRMRAAGPSNIRLAVYPGVHHALEGTAGINFAPNDWTSRDCAGRFVRDENFHLYDRQSGKRATDKNVTDFLFQTCMTRGHHIGGDKRVKAQATADLLQFLRDVDVLRDEEARSVVPDCTTMTQELQHENCARARNGWTGDLVALARGLHPVNGKLIDESVVSRIYELAARRGNAQAQWELAIRIRQGRGVARDPSRALSLARLAAEAGDPAGMNVYAVMLRDGIGSTPDEGSAAVWFQQSAALRNGFGLTNLGRFRWEGRGGLPIDRNAAIALWKRAVFQEQNPWAAIYLAEAFEKGEGVVADRAEAIRLYSIAAGQDRDPDAKKRAIAGLATVHRE